MSTLLNAIILWAVVIILATVLIYSLVKIFLISFRYRKEQRNNKEALQKVLDKK